MLCSIKTGILLTVCCVMQLASFHKLDEHRHSRYLLAPEQIPIGQPTICCDCDDRNTSKPCTDTCGSTITTCYYPEICQTTIVHDHTGSVKRKRCADASVCIADSSQPSSQSSAVCTSSDVTTAVTMTTCNYCCMTTPDQYADRQQYDICIRSNNNGHPTDTFQPTATTTSPPSVTTATGPICAECNGDSCKTSPHHVVHCDVIEDQCLTVVQVNTSGEYTIIKKGCASKIECAIDNSRQQSCQPSTGPQTFLPGKNRTCQYCCDGNQAGSTACNADIFKISTTMSKQPVTATSASKSTTKAVVTATSPSTVMPVTTATSPSTVMPVTTVTSTSTVIPVTIATSTSTKTIPVTTATSTSTKTISMTTATSTSTAMPVTTTSASTKTIPVTTATSASKSTTMPVTVTSVNTAMPVTTATSPSTAMPVKATSPITVIPVTATSPSTAIPVTATSPSTRTTTLPGPVSSTTTSTSVSTLPTTAPTASATMCEVCVAGTALCEAFYKSTKCEPPNNYCINVVTNRRDGSRIVNRTCGSIETCRRDWYYGTSDDDKCSSLSQLTFLDFACTFCCVEDNCNTPLRPADSTLYTERKGRGR